MVLKQLDVLNNTSTTCESKIYRCTACLILPSIPIPILTEYNQNLDTTKKVAKKKEPITLMPASQRNPYQKH